MVDLVGDAGGIDGRHRIAAADDAEGRRIRATQRAMAMVPAAKRWPLEDAHRAFQKMVPAADFAAIAVDSFRADVEDGLISEDAIDRADGVVALTESRDSATTTSVGRRGGRVFDLAVSEEPSQPRQAVRLRPATSRFQALRQQERVGHAAADEQGVDAVEQVSDHARACRRLWRRRGWRRTASPVAQQTPECVVSRCMRSPAYAGNRVRHALGRGVGAVGGAEGVVDVEIGQVRRARGELGVVRSSPGSNRRFSRRTTSPRRATPRPPASSSPTISSDALYRSAEQSAEAGGNWGKAECLVRPCPSVDRGGSPG